MLLGEDMENNYVSIVDGSEYRGEIPTTVSIPVSEIIDKGLLTSLVKATSGDSNYQSVLDTWMFTHGYVRKDITSKELVTVVLKGGAGSGHHGHKGIPGHQGGSLPRGASAAKKTREAMILANDLPKALQDSMKSDLTAIAEDLGFPPDRILYYNRKGKNFAVGSDKYESAAEFNGREIIIYSGSTSGDERFGFMFNKNVIAHEVSHYRYNLFQKLYRRQSSLLQKELNSVADTKSIMNAQGELTPEYKEKYWAYDIYERNFQYENDRQELWKYPVSGYGASYIDVARTSKYGVDRERAIDENLAEISSYALSYRGQRVTKEWANLYNEINQGLYSHKLIKNYVELASSNYSKG
jgi:hypothetical protein